MNHIKLKIVWDYNEQVVGNQREWHYSVVPRVGEQITLCTLVRNRAGEGVPGHVVLQVEVVEHRFEPRDSHPTLHCKLLQVMDT